MSAATVLADAYGEGACLYADVLGVPRDAPPAALRKAYYKKCLRHHPDKQPRGAGAEERAAAKRKFQAVSLAYAILSDEGRRREYDASGELVDEDEGDGGGDGVRQWTEYFESLFPKVTAADIDAFEVKYKCSDEEEADVIKYYSKFKGDLGKMLECVMLSSDADKERWVKDYIEPAVASGAVGDFMAKVQKTRGSAPPKRRKTKGRAGRKQKAEDARMEESDSDDESETPEAEVIGPGDGMEEEEVMDAKENKSNKKTTRTAAKKSPKKKSSAAKATKSRKKAAASSTPDEDLIAQIRGNALARRKGGFDTMMAGLEERYGGNQTKRRKGKKEEDSDIDDEEFAKIQARLTKNKKSR